MSFFTEMARLLRWKPKTVVFMLVQFLDDSGIHDQTTGHPTRIGVGGGMARCETWERLHHVWDWTLKQDHWPSKINWFHYKDWRHGKCEFESWTRNQRHALFEELTKLIGKSEMDFVCTTVAVTADENKTELTYIEAVIELIHHAELTSRLASSKDEQISLVISSQAEVSAARITKYFNRIKLAIPRLAHCEISDPRDRPELQIADVLAYELTRSHYPSMTWGANGNFRQDKKPTEIMQKIDAFAPALHAHFVRHLQ